MKKVMVILVVVLVFVSGMTLVNASYNCPICGGSPWMPVCSQVFMDAFPCGVYCKGENVRRYDGEECVNGHIYATSGYHGCEERLHTCGLPNYSICPY